MGIDEKKGAPWVGKKTIAIGAGVLALLLWILWPGDPSVNSLETATFEVRRGPLSIGVLEGGNVHALESHEFRSEIKTASGVTGTKILTIIEEGYEVTEEDVRDRKILVELDSSKIMERMFAHDLEFQTDLMNYTEADENRAIQASENQSSIKEVRQIVRFAGLDFEKYLGTHAALELFKERELPFDLETLTKYEEQFELMSREDEIEAADKATDSIGNSAASVDFLRHIEGEELGDGEAQQLLRQLRDETLVARNELSLAEENYKGSQRLAKKGFITQLTLENDQVVREKNRLAVQTAETQLELFRKYEFSKTAEELLSNYEEALHRLYRVKREASSRMAQAESRYRTTQRRYQLEEREKEDLEYQLEHCTIRAEVPGLVAYGGAETNYYKSRYYDAVTEGTEVRYGQPIITIPDMSKMAVTVNIHESYIKKIAIGQKARITVDAEPGALLEGNIAELAVLPDSANMRYNPNLKVYPASIHIEGTHEWLKPGMTAKVEIVVEDIEDTVYIPVQSVFVEDDIHFCYLADGNDILKRSVEVGQFNDEFIEIKAGLEKGEIVFLSKPPGSENLEAAEPLPDTTPKALAGN